jgi:hypothetical protein
MSFSSLSRRTENVVTNAASIRSQGSQPIDNLFSLGHQITPSFETAQYPFKAPINYVDGFAIIVPHRTFQDHAEGWADYRRGIDDSEALAYHAALQFVAESLHNSRSLGTPSNNQGERDSFYFRSNALSLGNDEASASMQLATAARILDQKFIVLVERLVRYIHCPSTGKPLSTQQLVDEENAVGVRFFFLALDPKFNFGSAFDQQIIGNRRTWTDYVEDSDEDDDFIYADGSSESSLAGGGDGGGGGGGGGGENQAFPQFGSKKGSSNKQMDPGSGASVGRGKKRNWGSSKSEASYESEDHQQEEDEDEMSSSVHASKNKQRQQKKGKKQVEEENEEPILPKDRSTAVRSKMNKMKTDIGWSKTRMGKQRQRLVNNRDGTTAGVPQSNKYLSARGSPDKQYARIIDPRMLGTLLFDGQRNEKIFDSKAAARDINYKFSDRSSPNYVCRLLSLEDMIRASKNYGCAPEQCDVSRYVQFLNGNNPAFRRDNNDGGVDVGPGMEQDGEEEDEVERQNRANVVDHSHPTFRTAFPNITWCFSPYDFSASALYCSFFPWQRLSSRYLNELILSSLLRSYQKNICDPSAVVERQLQDIPFLGIVPPNGNVPHLDAERDPKKFKYFAEKILARTQPQSSGGCNRSVAPLCGMKDVLAPLLPLSATAAAAGGASSLQDAQQAEDEEEYGEVYNEDDFGISDSFGGSKKGKKRAQEDATVAMIEKECILLQNNRSFRQVMHSIGFRTAAEEKRMTDRLEYTRDPTSVVSRLFMQLEDAIYKVFGKYKSLFRRYMDNMRNLAVIYMYKTLDLEDDRLPDTVLAILAYMKEKDIRVLAQDSNIISLDIGIGMNALVQILLQLETLRISSAHIYVMDVTQAIFSAYFDKNRTKIGLKLNIKLYGPPGTGKSTIAATAASLMIENTVMNITARSNLAMVNPKTQNYTTEIWDESSVIFDEKDSKLNTTEKKSKRMEQSMMTRQEGDYQVTEHDPITKKRRVAHIKTEYNHSKIIASNYGPKQDALDDRISMVPVDRNDRVGQNIGDYELCTTSREWMLHQDSVQTANHMVQMSVFFGAVANKFVVLPNVNLDVLSIRFAQTQSLLKRCSPNTKLRIRLLQMIKMQAVVETMCTACKIVFGSELSPFRRLEHISFEEPVRGSNGGTIKCTKTDLALDEFRYEDLKLLGPYLVCNDDTAIRVITTSVANIIDSIRFAVIKAIALEYGSLDIREVFRYIDDAGLSGYKARAPYYNALEEAIHFGDVPPPVPDFMQAESRRSPQRPPLFPFASSSSHSSTTSSFAMEADTTTDNNDTTTSTNTGAKKSSHRRFLEKNEIIASLENSTFENSSDANVANERDKSGATKRRILPMGHSYYISPNRVAKKSRSGNGNQRRKAREDESVRQIFVPVLSSANGNGKSALSNTDQSNKPDPLASTTVRKIPAFNMVSEMEGKSCRPHFCVSYLKLSASIAELKRSVDEMCRKYNLEKENYLSTLEYLEEASVCNREISNIPEGLEQNREFIYHKLAQKTDILKEDIRMQTEDALFDGTNDSSYLSVEFLLDAPDRIIQQLAREYSYEHTQKRTVMLGMRVEEAPYLMKSMQVEPIKGRIISVHNPIHMDERIFRSSIYMNMSKRSGKPLHDPLASMKRLEIDGDIELWAVRRHFESSGYNTSMAKYFTPAAQRYSLHAIYADCNPRPYVPKQQGGNQDGADAPNSSLFSNLDALYTDNEERGLHLKRMAALYCIQRGVPLDDFQGEEYKKTRNGFIDLISYYNSNRRTPALSLLRYPEDLGPGASGLQFPAQRQLANQQTPTSIAHFYQHSEKEIAQADKEERATETWLHEDLFAEKENVFEEESVTPLSIVQRHQMYVSKNNQKNNENQEDGIKEEKQNSRNGEQKKKKNFDDDEEKATEDEDEMTSTADPDPVTESHSGDSLDPNEHSFSTIPTTSTSFTTTTSDIMARKRKFVPY